MGFIMIYILIITKFYIQKNNTTMTTKKDFIQAAKTISEIENSEKRKEIAENYCTTFAKSNPRFDKAKFLKACNC